MQTVNPINGFNLYPKVPFQGAEREGQPKIGLNPSIEPYAKLVTGEVINVTKHSSKDTLYCAGCCLLLFPARKNRQAKPYQEMVNQIKQNWREWNPEQKEFFLQGILSTLNNFELASKIPQLSKLSKEDIHAVNTIAGNMEINPPTFVKWEIKKLFNAQNGNGTVAMGGTYPALFLSFPFLKPNTQQIFKDKVLEILREDVLKENETAWKKLITATKNKYSL